ncbi:uncharacterized protein LOC118422785 [Branchiostoma floridae]|uniref:Uncharacterized protein LOC118422785 n=1 Tax=Branchiostoma floridae TaxID=7739 RepID=A0A9J7N1G5_BRAFL|nr:uncharacterized protein LOC118422785 [Branchiostoma floridae]
MPRLYPIRVITSVVLCACLLMGVSVLVGQHELTATREQSSDTIHRLESNDAMTAAPRTPVVPSKVQRNLLREKPEDPAVSTPAAVLPTDSRVFPKNNIRQGTSVESNNTKIPDPPMESEVVKTVVTYKMRGDKIIRIIKKYVRKRPKPPPAVDSNGQLNFDKPESKNNSDTRTSGSVAEDKNKTSNSEKRIDSPVVDSAINNMLSSKVPAHVPKEANSDGQSLLNNAQDGVNLDQTENTGDKKTEEDLKKTNEELRPNAEGNVPNANDKSDDSKDDHEEAADPCKPKDEDYERDITTIVTYAKKGTKTIKIIKKIIRKRLKPKRIWEEINNGTENNLPEYEQYDQEQIQDQIDFKIENRCNTKRGFTQRFQEEVAEIEEEMEVGSVNNRTSPRAHKRMTKKDLATKYILPDVLKFVTGNTSSWTFDYKALAQKRFDLERTCNARNHFFVTKKNIPLGSSLRYDVSNTTVKVNNTLFDTFPTAIPFADKMFPRCAVVGSSGILMDSGCGREIDSSDFVIRFNMAPVGGRFRADVGSKVDIVTVNGDSIKSRYDKLETNISRTMFAAYVRQYNRNTLLWSVPFTSLTHTAYVLRTYQVLKKAGAPQAVVFANPGYMACTNTYWRQRGFTRAPRLSTGMFLTSAALQFCEEVYLYGFWPFPVDTAGNVLPYHYYSKGQRGRLNKWHKMDDEYVNLMELHKKGILHLQTDKCRDS